MLKKLSAFILKLPIFQRPRLKAIILHTTLGLIIGLAMGMISRKLPIDQMPELSFVLLGLIFALLGFLHTRALFRRHSWADANRFWKESGFTVGVTVLCAGAFILMLISQHSSPYNWVIATSTVCLLVPFFIDRAIKSRKNIPAAIHPGVIITDINNAQGLISFTGQHTKKYLKLLFLKDEYGYLPKEAFIPVTKEVEALSLEQILKSVILFTNHSERPDQPIKLDHQKEEDQLVEFKWYFWQRNLFWSRRYFQPKKQLRDFDFSFRPVEEVDPDGNVRRIECVVIYIDREEFAVIREPQLQVAHLRITG